MKTYSKDEVESFCTPNSKTSKISGLSEIDLFEKKWENIIKAGIEENHTDLNLYAHWMIQKPDIAKQSVQKLIKNNRDLQRELLLFLLVEDGLVVPCRFGFLREEALFRIVI